MAAQKCPICGAEIPGDIVGVLCPRCVLKEAIAEECGVGSKLAMPSRNAPSGDGTATLPSSLGTRLR